MKNKAKAFVIYIFTLCDKLYILYAFQRVKNFVPGLKQRKAHVLFTLAIKVAVLRKVQSQ